MKANELQIGDYIMFNKNIYIIEEISKKGWVHLIHNDGSECRVELSSDYILDFITPIPLTAEILEKNFLTQRGEWTEPVLYFFGDDYIEVSIKEYTEGIWEVVIDEVEMSGLPSWRMYVSDVHQLQHALRLCNIDKEIEL